MTSLSQKRQLLLSSCTSSRQASAPTCLLPVTKPPSPGGHRWFFSHQMVASQDGHCVCPRLPNEFTSAGPGPCFLVSQQESPGGLPYTNSQALSPDSLIKNVWGGALDCVSFLQDSQVIPIQLVYTLRNTDLTHSAQFSIPTFYFLRESFQGTTNRSLTRFLTVCFRFFFFLYMERTFFSSR